MYVYIFFSIHILIGVIALIELLLSKQFKVEPLIIPRHGLYRKQPPLLYYNAVA